MENLDIRNTHGMAKVVGTIVSLASAMTMTLYKGPAVTLKKYPAQLSLTAWMSFVGGAQSAVFTAFVQHKPSAWKFGFNIDFWSIIYGGMVCSGLIIFIQLWCIEKRGPVFVTMFNPLSTILVAFLAYFVLGEKLHTGSILGGFIVIVGLYMVLWGKEGDQTPQVKSDAESSSDYEEQKESKING
ncbi:hypothetical protein IFM89_005923 [Coptis chinensis]|uniref:WAT1-related protein n=1 Tax=Coptis chinensis TaxID=261450 RepID=A0A835IB78_9MAGN|nr:hypothetical protein IFM89_005923 [Coptis chinensis]